MPSLERFVYLVRAGDNHYKVGIAQDVHRRIKEIQTGNPVKVELVTAAWLANAQQAEGRIHKWLSHFKSDGGREWFELTSTQALALVIKMSGLSLPEDVSRYMVIRNLVARQEQLERKFAELNAPPPEPPKEKPLAALRAEEDIDAEVFDNAMRIVFIAGKASASMLQRRLRVGYARASRLLDQLEEAKIIGPADGARPRDILISDLPTPKR